jgi:hypothetical protein
MPNDWKERDLSTFFSTRGGFTRSLKTHAVMAILIAAICVLRLGCRREPKAVIGVVVSTESAAKSVALAVDEISEWPEPNRYEIEFRYDGEDPPRVGSDTADEAVKRASRILAIPDLRSPGVSAAPGTSGGPRSQREPREPLFPSLLRDRGSMPLRGVGTRRWTLLERGAE